MYSIVLNVLIYTTICICIYIYIGVDKKVKFWRVSGYPTSTAFVVSSTATSKDTIDLAKAEEITSVAVDVAATDGDNNDEEEEEEEQTTDEVEIKDNKLQAAVASLQINRKTNTTAAATTTSTRKRKDKKKKKKNVSSSVVDTAANISIDLVWSLDHNRKINIVKCFSPPYLESESATDTISPPPSLARGVFVMDASSSDIYIYKPH